MMYNDDVTSVVVHLAQCLLEVHEWTDAKNHC